jgi:hypothetical protein
VRQATPPGELRPQGELLGHLIDYIEDLIEARSLRRLLAPAGTHELLQLLRERAICRQLGPGHHLGNHPHYHLEGVDAGVG